MAQYPYDQLGTPLDTANLEKANGNWAKIEADIKSVNSSSIQRDNALGTDYTSKLNAQKNEYTALLGAQKTDYLNRLSFQKQEYTSGFQAQKIRIDNIVSEITDETLAQVVDEAKLIWQEPVNDASSLVTAYPEATIGYASQTLDDNKIYRFDGTQWVYIQSFGNGPFTDVYERLEEQKYFVSSKSLGLLGDGTTDETSAIQSAINAVSDSADTLFMQGVFVLSSPVLFKGRIIGGTFILKDTGQVVMKEFADVKDIKVLVHGSCTSTSAILYEEKEAKIDNLLLTSTSGVIKEMIGVHFRGAGVTCFNYLFNAHIRFASIGLFIDSTDYWITNIEVDHIRIDYFDEYAFRVGATIENVFQNSQHNIDNITIQDTEGTRLQRVGLSMGDAWSNYSNIVTFADNPVGTFIPLHMPGLSDNLIEVIRETRSNTLDGMILEGNPLCNGYAYLHNLNGIRLLRNRFINDGLIQIAQADTKPRVSLALSSSPTVRIPQNIINDLITPGNITYTYSNGVISVRNNATVPLYFILDVKLPPNVKSSLKEGKFSTVSMKTNMAESTTLKTVLSCSLRDQSEANLDIDSIAYSGVFEKRQVSYAAFHTNTNVLEAAFADEVYVRVGFSNIPAGATYTIEELHFYNQLVPAINENNISWTKRNTFN